MKNTISFPLPEVFTEDMILKVSKDLYADIQREWIEDDKQGARMKVEIDEYLEDKDFQIIR